MSKKFVMTPARLAARRKGGQAPKPRRTLRVEDRQLELIATALLDLIPARKRAHDFEGSRRRWPTYRELAQATKLPVHTIKRLAHRLGDRDDGMPRLAQLRLDSLCDDPTGREDWAVRLVSYARTMLDHLAEEGTHRDEHEPPTLYGPS